MDIIPVLDIMNNNVVKAIKGDRAKYEPINYKLYNTIKPIEIIYQLSKRYSPNIIYIADLDAISQKIVNHKLFNTILNIFPKIDLIPIIQSVVDDYNNIYHAKSGIKILCIYENNKNYIINGIENRIEQIVANLLDNAISFSKNNQNIEVKVTKDSINQVLINIIDEGPGFRERDTTKIFKRFYSNRPDKFGQHSGLGLNIVKNLIELHKASITASNRTDKNGANLEIIFPKA